MRLSDARFVIALWVVMAALLLGGAGLAQAPEGAPVKKLSADDKAWKAARSTTDPEKRLEAFREYVRDFPEHKDRVSRARDSIMTVLLDSFPERAGEIAAEVAVAEKAAGKGLDGDYSRVYLAWQLAEAGGKGVDLKEARKMALGCVGHLKESEFDAYLLKAYAKYKLPPLPAEEVHHQFANRRAEALAVLADVYLREGKVDRARPLVKEAYGLDALVDDVNSQRGRLALLDHDEALALESFERAQLVGAVSKGDRTTMMELYRRAHGGSDAGFEAELDASYKRLYPEVDLGAAKGASGLDGKVARTVLVELFTGSACGPCVGGDLGVEGVLKAYPRSEVVALAFDQHIPEPDPLTNPDSVARADLYAIGGTPTFVIDGSAHELLYGGDREAAKKLYPQLAQVVAGEAAVGTGVGVSLTVKEGAGGVLDAAAQVTMPDAAALEAAVAVKPVESDQEKEAAAKEAEEKKAEEVKKAAEAKKAALKKGTAKAAEAKPAVAAEAAKPAEPAAKAKPHVVVNFALVEDDLRYSGENGIRFHRMVVRALAKPASEGFEVEPGKGSELKASFDPAQVSAGLRSYLDGYENQNERFGKVTFLSKDTAMRAEHLGVAVWVQDTVSHRVLAAGYVPVSKSSDGARQGDE